MGLHGQGVFTKHGIAGEQDVVDSALASRSQFDHFVDVNKMILGQMPTRFAGCFGFADDLTEFSPLGVTQQILNVACQPIFSASFRLLRMPLKGVGDGWTNSFFMVRLLF